MGKFYLPELVRVRNMPIIVYPCEGVEELLDRRNTDSIRSYLALIYRTNRIPGRVPGSADKFNIDILWNVGRELMADIWQFSQLDSWGSGALSLATTFRNYFPDKNFGTSAEFGHSMLGREAEHRMGRSFRSYIRTRPVLHPATTNGKRFYF